MTSILAWLKSGLLFGIFSSVILLLSPNKSYEKHISLVVGLLFILVMIHPVMSFLNLDGQTYISFIQKYISAAENGSSLSENERSLYADTIGIQLKDTLKKAGFNVKSVYCEVDDNGHIGRVVLSFEGEVNDITEIENYIRNVFGKEVEIVYER